VRENCFNFSDVRSWCQLVEYSLGNEHKNFKFPVLSAGAFTDNWGFEGQLWTVSPLSKNAVKLRRCRNRATSKQHNNALVPSIDASFFDKMSAVTLCSVISYSTFTSALSCTNTRYIHSCCLGKSESWLSGSLTTEGKLFGARNIKKKKGITHCERKT
jgi:hypothetical protein